MRLLGEPILVWKDLFQSLLFQNSYPITPSGDGHPVLVLPGLLGHDFTTSFLRKFIEDLGYTPYGWEMGTNYGDLRKLKILLQDIEALHEEHQEKVSIIGWSLGGVYARQLAKRRPELIRQVITLGSPFINIEESNNAAWVYKLFNENRPLNDEDLAWKEDLPSKAPVPTTAIYSKIDGIVPWQNCMESPEDDWHQNVEVEGSHFGLPYIPAVWVVIEDRLQFKQANWQAFQRKEGLDDLVYFP